VWLGVFLASAGREALIVSRIHEQIRAEPDRNNSKNWWNMFAVVSLFPSRQHVYSTLMLLEYCQRPCMLQSETANRVPGLLVFIAVVTL
jgi:hypothetical protein